MKFTNELKVGLISLAAITLLIVGLFFLKGKNLYKNGFFLYAKYNHTKGIAVTNGVFVNGFKVGSVYDIANADLDLKEIIITIKLDAPFHIPKNSVAVIKENPLGAPSIEINVGNDKNFLASGDTIFSGKNDGIIGSITNKFAPIGDKLLITMMSLDSVLIKINDVLNNDNQNNIHEMLVNLNKTTSNLSKLSSSFNNYTDPQNGSITQTLNNITAFTKNLDKNDSKINKMMTNLEKTTENLSKTVFDGLVSSLKKTIENMNGIIEKMEKKDGSIGLLLNDKALYNNLTNTIRSANILIDDLKVHPKRYVNVSVFGKKDKSQPLSTPLIEKNP